MKLIDIYAGIGGGSLGARHAGMEPCFAFETDVNAQIVYGNNLGIPPQGDPLLADLKNTPHPDVVFAAPTRDLLMALNMRGLIQDLHPRAVLIELPLRLASLIRFTGECMREIGYKVWFDRLDALDYGLPQKRIRNYAVCFRNDVKTYFSSFPFPDRLPGKKLSDILEKDPDPRLFVGDKVDLVVRRNAANVAAGVGYRNKILSSDQVSPSLPLDYHKDKLSLLVDQGSGARSLSLLECKRLMGFPDDWSMPIAETEALRLLAAASCPPVVGGLLKEIGDWIDF